LGRPTLSHPFFGSLVRDGDFPWWKGSLVYPSLAECWIRFMVDWEGHIRQADPNLPPHPTAPPERVSLMVCDEAGMGPTLEQETAYHDLLQHPDEVAALLFQAMTPIAKAALDEARIEAEEVGTTGEFDAVIRDFGLDTPDGVRLQVELLEIGFLEQHRDGRAYLSFDFNCGWDEEHGVSILVHAGNVLAVSGCADFYNRGDALEPHLESIRRHSL
jgi:hypothetical protein